MFMNRELEKETNFLSKTRFPAVICKRNMNKEEIDEQLDQIRESENLLCVKPYTCTPKEYMAKHQNT